MDLRDFRAAVFAKIPGALDPDASWKVAIETPLDGYCDVTLASPGTFLIIENKIVASARRDRQFVTYYEAAARLHPDDRVIAVYLGPTADTGTDERAISGSRPRIDAGRSSRFSMMLRERCASTPGSPTTGRPTRRPSRGSSSCLSARVATRTH